MNNKPKTLLTVVNGVTERTKDLGWNIFSFAAPMNQIASLLNYNKYPVIIDNFTLKNNTFNENIKDIVNEKYNYIGLFFNIDLYKSSLVYSKEIKKHLPNTKIIMFYRLSDEITNDMLSKSYVDIAVVDEEDYALLDIVSGKDLKDIKGISYKDENNNIIHNEPRITEDNLDFLPEASYGYEVTPKDIYKNTYLLTDRGCFGKCIFCCEKYPKKECKVKYRNPELVGSEIRHLIDRYNIPRINFYNCTFTTNKKYVYALMDAFDKYDIKIDWSCQTRVDVVDYDLLKCMKDHKCDSIAYGVEATDPNIMKFINKGITLDQVNNAVSYMKKADLYTKLHFILGFPGETIETIINSINFCKKINPEAFGFYIATPMPGTALYDYCVENDLLLTKDWDRYTSRLQIIKLENIQDYKIEKYQKLTKTLAREDPKGIFR
jgi:radical SAM superfamily enzyme YgiQ (UPF0313 family)